MLWLERAWRAFWPLVSWCLLCLGLAFVVYDMPFVAIAAGLAVGLVLLVFGLFRLNPPRLSEAIDRVDRPLKGRPLYSLMDQSAMGDADLWHLQQTRLQRTAEGARVHWGHFQIATLDPFGLRLVALLVCLVGVLFGTSPASFGGRTQLQNVADAGMGAMWEGWIIPPEFTGKPTIYLADVLDDPDLEIFQSSVIELRSYGTQAYWVEQTLTQSDPPAGAIQRITVEQDGRLSITAAPEKTWDVTIKRDQPPTAEITGEFSVEFFGTSTVPYKAQDDFGITQSRLLITLDDPLLDRRFGLIPEYQGDTTLSEAISLPIGGRKTDISDVISQDFSQSVFAHLPVRVVLEVTDSAGSVGVSDPLFTRLPARKFFDPLAASLIEVRRDLLWSNANDKRVLRVMRAILYQPQSDFRRETHYLLLRNIADRWDTALMLTASDNSRNAIAADLWDLAVAIEEGDVEDALERMREAQERLSEAIKNGATPEEIEKLMQDLKAANDNYMRQKRQQAERNFAEMTPEERSMMRENQTLTMNTDDLQALMDRIQELMENGQMAEALQALQALQEYQDMIENMQMAQSESGGEGGNPAETMDDLANTLREQQDLSDQSFDQLQNQFNGQEGSGSSEDLAGRQSDLQEQLEAQRRRAPQLDGKAAREGQKALREAQEAMKQAEDALRDGDFGDALDQQSQAMDALREGIQSFDQAMAENSDQAGGENQENAGGERSDPLGRSQGQNGQNGVSDTQVGSAEGDKKKSEIINEIRRRSGELDRSEKERDYLKRLLDRF